MQARGLKIAEALDRPSRQRAGARVRAAAGAAAPPGRPRAQSAASSREISNQLAALRKRLARSARNGIATNPGGAAQAPAGAPAAVGLVIAAGNAIAGLPYLYGGGHAGFKDTAYDCSGSVSYALAAAGLVNSPMASGPGS